ncbi:hypothetical protein SKAU_G00226000 [Synaphobranchus kaupii]|uniref:Ig-like domain-containing protein n=1 Tax=Synaphobranchus kaupii TaxID=118154 RepID=A0A9Q1FCA1_SYNKA|nr:hypothetical protein SKAU_G00226000 [Synaphobranchus kaupii]
MVRHPLSPRRLHRGTGCSEGASSPAPSSSPSPWSSVAISDTLSATYTLPLTLHWFSALSSCPKAGHETTGTSQGAASQRVRVDPEVQSYPGETVNLRCAFADKGDLQLTQVSWIWERTDGAKDNIAVYHPEFGSRYPQSPFKGRISFPNPSLDNPSVVISDLKMTDEGLYTCEYAIYPTGNEQATTTLIMLAKPRNTAFIVTVIAGKNPIVVARCESADAKPPAQIKWVSLVNANGTTTSKPGADNTVTVSSEYRLVPTPADNGKDISCVISHPTQDKPQTMPLKLAIEYPPKVTIVGYDNNWYVGRTNVMLTCQATGNPVLTSVTWKVLTGRMPDAVQVKENKLMVLKVDESVNTTFVCEVKNRLGVGKDQVTVVVSGAASQRVRVDPEVQSYPGETVNLRCAFADKGDLQLTQVSWIWERTDGAKDNIAVYHPEFGSRYPQSPFTGRISFPNPSLDNPSVVISDLKMTDEGKYICEFSTYPSGNQQGSTTLIMLAKPRNTAFIVTVIAGKKPVVVARCESADAKPPAQIKWVSVVNANGTTTSKPGADNTVTVSSEYWLVPTPADNGKDISCVISHPTQDKPQTMPLKLAIEYPPKVTIVGYDNNWYVGRTNVMLTCQATGNPVLTSVTWKVISGRMPATVQVKENKLMVLKVDESVNTTFVCEVKNRLGVGKDQVTVVVSGAASQRVRVDPEVQSYPGETVNLRCAFADKGDLQLTQVLWIWERTDGAKDNIAVYHPEFGSRYPQSPFKGRISFPNPSLDNSSVVISDLKMTDEGKYICEFSTYPSGNQQGTTTLIMLDQLEKPVITMQISEGIVDIACAASQRVRVDPEVQSYPGETVNLRCADKGDLQLTQVSWIWERTDGAKDNIAVYHPQFGSSYPQSPFTGRISFPNPSLDNSSVVISDLKMTDEGKYICEFIIYPSGIQQGTTTLIMLAKPRNTAFIVTVIAGKKPVVVARCESADGKPPAQIKWVSVVNAKGTTTLKPGADNKVTVSSEYWLVPTPADNGKDISCVISHPTQDKPQSMPLKLAIEYPPKVTIVGYDNNWYVGRTNVMLTCQATGNPVLTSVTWKVLSGRMPDAVQVKENKLMVLKVDESVNTTFVCEVKNRLGVGKDQVTVVVSAGLLWRHILSVLVLLAAIGLLIEHFISHTPSTAAPGRKSRGSERTGEFVETVC